MQLTSIRYNCCTCNARIRAPASVAGRKCACPRCGSVMTVPSLNGQSDATHSGQSKPREQPVCSFCMGGIEDGDAKTVCDACELPFHTECWKFNLGCSAYGCKRQHALKKGPDVRIDPGTLRQPSRPGEESLWASPAKPRSERFPREYLYLLASIACFFLGLLLYGFPSLVCLLGGTLCFVGPARRRHHGALILGAIGCLAGVIAGLICSNSFWN
jgi:hypothetical protein